MRKGVNEVCLIGHHLKNPERQFNLCELLGSTDICSPVMHIWLQELH